MAGRGGVDEARERVQDPHLAGPFDAAFFASRHANTPAVPSPVKLDGTAKLPAGLSVGAGSLMAASREGDTGIRIVSMALMVLVDLAFVPLVRIASHEMGISAGKPDPLHPPSTDRARLW